MAVWLSTSEAAERLGTTLATVRSLVNSGQLTGVVQDRNVRRRWRIDAASVEAYLAERGRVDERRAARLTISAAQQGEITRLADEIAALRSALRGRPTPVEHSRVVAQNEQQRAELGALRDVVLRLRARADAVEEAERQNAAAVEHLSAAVTAQANAAAALRRALGQADEALGQLLIPDTITE